MSLRTARNVRVIGEAEGRTIGWWGTVIGLIALAHLVAAVNVAAVYLRSVSGTWPPGATEPPEVWMGLLAVGLAVLAAVATGVAAAIHGRGGGPLGMPMLFVAALLALGAAGVRGAGTIFSDHPVTEHAYWSMRWFMGGLDVTLLGATGIALLTAAVHAVRGWLRPGAHAELASITLWTAIVAVFVGVNWLVLTGVTLWWGG
ncbi:hypothetical protein [Egicoccus halophilus]|uniref:Uncharacterized protein n=1 Tax=Egicoccus halophilus TaxID=1670830 RepID=A0A8J3A783_9ACTN|nr:hypothetical protein [Egicoccus halophilus]GGI03025.1 hypothetical protein GCM10011354_02360 [Egicoccus halophilus]